MKKSLSEKNIFFEKFVLGIKTSRILCWFRTCRYCISFYKRLPKKIWKNKSFCEAKIGLNSSSLSGAVFSLSGAVCPSNFRSIEPGTQKRLIVKEKLLLKIVLYIFSQSRNAWGHAAFLNHCTNLRSINSDLVSLSFQPPFHL